MADFDSAQKWYAALIKPLQSRKTCKAVHAFHPFGIEQEKILSIDKTRCYPCLTDQKFAKLLESFLCLLALLALLFELASSCHEIAISWGDHSHSHLIIHIHTSRPNC